MDPTILVTGATGFLGGAVTTQLLQSPKIGNMVLLIRGQHRLPLWSGRNGQSLVSGIPFPSKRGSGAR
jgi:uncharacterized protein YbjT (DUF2867 family)